MSLNLELKIKLENFQTTIGLLEKIGAEYKGILNQRDVYYTVPSGLLKLRTVNGRQEFIRYNRNETVGNRYSDYHILEITTPGAETFFNAALRVETVVEKKRKLYMYDNTRVHLDDVTGLGLFLELETLVINGNEDAETRFNKIIELLRLDISKQIKASYKNLADAKHNH